METMAKDEGSPSPVVTREVRAHVVDRVRQPGNTVHSVARDLELPETAGAGVATIDGSTSIAGRAR